MVTQTLDPPESPVLFRLKTWSFTIVLALLAVFFGYRDLTGPHGLLHARQRREALAARRADLAALHARRMTLEVRARLLRDDGLSKDLLEERAHQVLGFVGPGDYVIR
jgi:cell division protein FtsB